MIRLDGMTPAAFLARHWQKRPLLVRAALPGFVSPLDAEGLAGLACTERVESRLVLREAGARPFEQRDGPFREADFAALPERGWTLLVQAVDRVVPKVADLIEEFRFVPNWRLDDVLVSYAVDGGGVGPHVDRYDVFLLQGSGRRRWRIRQRQVADERMVEGADLPVLDDFEPEEEWILEPGDLLYLPPGVAHCGTALGPCLTYSVGFRAPSLADLAAAWLAEVAGSDAGSRLYADPDLMPPTRPGAIDPIAPRRARELIEQALRDESAFARWFGRFVTEPRRGELDGPAVRPLSAPRLRHALVDGNACLRRCSTACFAYDRIEGHTYLFVCGEEIALDDRLEPIAGLLCDGATLSGPQLAAQLDSPDRLELLAGLLNRGYLLLDDEPTAP